MQDVKDKSTKQSTAREARQKQPDNTEKDNVNYAPIPPILIQDLFLDSVSKRNSQPAVITANTIITHEQLYHMANQWGRYIRESGVKSNTLVAILMDKGWEQVVAAYGVLQSGAAYVPIDPNQPQERINWLLENSQTELILTQSRLKNQISWPEDTKRVYVDSEDLSEIDDSELEHLQGPDDLAYVIYTSGSTGEPKGVMLNHRGVVNALIQTNNSYKIDSDSRVLAVTALHHDMSVYDVFGVIGAGGALIMPNPEGRRDPAHWSELMLLHRPTVWNSVPAMMDMLLEFADAKPGAIPATLRYAFLGGDWIPVTLPERLVRHVPDATVVSVGGPTETTLWNIWYPVNEVKPDWNSIPYGTPIANTKYYILDDKMNVCPAGVIGEMYIHGAGVASGYWRDHDKTCKSFIIYPKTGERLYRSGDLGRLLPDGNIEFCGRVDLQVKLRGNRVELGEIETILNRHPDIKQAVVTVREDEPGEKKLVAYITQPDRCSTNITVLRNYIDQYLPDYMMPGAWVFLNKIPLTQNGKIDRKSLPKPGRERPELSQPYSAPRTRLEKYLAALWCDVLNIDQVGVNDRFFELGGTSLQAANFIATLHKDLGEFIYTITIFNTPTVSEYAIFLESEYQNTIKEKFGLSGQSVKQPSRSHIGKEDNDKVNRQSVNIMRKKIIPALHDTRSNNTDKNNSRAIFVLSTPRSGTTLFRVMLAGHPSLFATAELLLLGFNTLKERRSAYTGKFELWLEGLIRAIMEIKQCGADEARSFMKNYEESDCTTREFYQVLQEMIGDKTLVEKSPAYSLDMSSMEKAERDFDKPTYVHLTRHPYSMVCSFEKNHTDQVLFLNDHNFSSRVLGELIWLISHQNILDFLDNIPEERKCRVQFESLVKHPKDVMEGLSRSLNIDYDPILVDPYRDMDSKMVDGIHKTSIPMGDTNFLEHKRIDPKVADSMNDVNSDNFLSEMTWTLAEKLGYINPDRIDIESGADLSSSRNQVMNRRRNILQKRRKSRE